MAVLTRTEAETRARLIRPTRMHVELDLTEPHRDHFDSVTTIDFECTEPGASSFCELAPHEVGSITLNGTELSPDSLQDNRILLDDLRPSNHLQVSAVMSFSDDGEGLHRHIDGADGQAYLYAMSFLDAAGRWFACFDQPDLKCRYSMTVRTPTGWTVLGNGPFVEVEPGLWRLNETQPLATYFVTLVAGPYASELTWHELETGQRIRLGVHARASLAAELPGGLAEQAEDILRVTGQGFDAYQQLFGIAYPFGDYHQVFVPDFNAGAMENPGCVTLREQYLFRGAATDAQRASRAGTVVHELAHQWFGDLVTMTWWDDLWLNESFAELMAHWVCTEWTDYPLWVEFGIQRKDWGAVTDQGPNTHPVAGNGAGDTVEALSSFDGISYAKGAGLLKQLLARMGTETFLAGVRDHLERFAFGNARFADLLAAWQRAGDEQIHRWAEAWLLTSGMDVLTVERAPDGRTIRVRRDSDSPLARPHALELVGLDAAGSILERHPITLDADQITTEQVTLEVERPDLFWALDPTDVAWARLRPSDPVDQWPPLDRIAEPLLRVSLWNSLRDQVRHGEVDPAVALDLVCDQLVAESEVVVVESVFGWAQRVLAGSFVPAGRRSTNQARLAELAERLLRSAEQGSDRALTAWRCLLQSTTDWSRLRDFLMDKGIPAGCELDTELRWQLVRRMALLARGPERLAETRTAIAQVAAGDRSSAGHLAELTAVASLGDPGEKERVFAALTEPGDLSAYELYALAGAMFPAEQTELTEPFVRRFFEAIPATATFRSGWSLARIVGLMFPAYNTSASTLAYAEQTLARGDLDDGVRRPLAEATQGLRQALASQSIHG